MDTNILKEYETQFIKLVVYLDEEHTKTASIKGVLTISGDSFLVKGDYNTQSGLIKDVKFVKRWHQ